MMMDFAPKSQALAELKGSGHSVQRFQTPLHSERTVAQTVVHDHTGLSCSCAAVTWLESRLFVEVEPEQRFPGPLYLIADLERLLGSQWRYSP
jgi:hypothetical protein